MSCCHLPDALCSQTKQTALSNNIQPTPVTRPQLNKLEQLFHEFICHLFLIFFPRTVREVSSAEQDKVISDSKLLDSLVTVLQELKNNDATAYCCSQPESPKDKKSCQRVMYNVLGYEIKRLNSTIPGAGRGVFVTRGKVPVGSLVALYPGIRYTF